MKAVILTVAWLMAAAFPLLVAGTPAMMRAEAGAVTAAPAATPQVDRSPNDLALTLDGRFAVTANRTAHTVSLVDLAAGKVVDEKRVGREPFAVALTPDGKRALVSCYGDNTLSVIDVAGSSLRVVSSVAVGDEPRGITLSPDGRTAYVALAGEESVAVVDLAVRRVTERLPVGAEPWHLARTPDGKRLVVGCSRARTIVVLDLASGKPVNTVRALCRNLRHVAISLDGTQAYLPGISERGMGTTRDNIDRGWVVGNRLLRVPLTEAGAPRETLTLDTQGNAVGDVDGCALSPDGKTLALTAGGTHELLLLRPTNSLPFVSYGGSGDHIDPDLRSDSNRFQRVKLGGRPAGARFTPDGRRIVVANYLQSALQVVEVASGKLERSIPLGSAPAPSLARRGEAIFTDADRSFNRWYSCATCHVEAGENGASVDTFNDGGIGKLKQTPSLVGVTGTAPWTWHGWRKDLREVVHDSFLKSMQGAEPSAEEVDAVLAYLASRERRPNPNRTAGGERTPAVRRGEIVFGEKGCTSCHASPTYTTAGMFKTGLEEPGDVYEGYNPPSLLGIYRTAPYLHDGRASTLEEVITRYHNPSKISGKPDCTPQETADLVAFLKSL